MIAADVYSVPTHVGRGGGSWCTGSVGWMYRLIVESLLGPTKIDVDKLHFTGCLPAEWTAFKIHHRYCKTCYHIEVVQTRDGLGAMRVMVTASCKTTRRPT